MTHGIAMMIEALVAVLLAVTIFYCVLLNKRLRRLKSDELSLKATISELITATEIAERAVAGLKVAVRECDQDLGGRLNAAEKFSADIAAQITAGEAVLSRLARIAGAARPRETEISDAKSTLAAAQAFAERTAARVTSAAA